MSQKNEIDTKQPKEAQIKSEKAANSMQGGIMLLVIWLGLTYVIYENFFDFPIGKIVTYVLGVIGFVLLMITISSFFDWRRAKRIEKAETDAEFEEKEFSEIDPSKRALRAEKLFRLNQKDLMRYYDMNLAQTKFLSGLGIVMIALGILLVITSLSAYALLEIDKVILIIGNISGIVLDFVGALFITMYNKNIEAAVKFHAKFAESNNLLLANSIANKIENEELREKTLSEISREIIAVKVEK